MKYTGSIVIFDESNPVFERELSDDEIVKALLSSIPDAEGEYLEPTPPLRTNRSRRDEAGVLPMRTKRA